MARVGIRSGFADDESRRDFFLISAITFFCFLSMTMLVFLPKIMFRAGYTETEIGIVMFMSALPVLVANLGGGVLAGRFRSISLVAVALALVACGILLVYFVLDDLFLLLLSRIVFGSGIGLMTTIGMVYAKSLLTPSRFVHLFGIYSTMFTVPFFFGPAMAEAYLAHFGERYFFVAIDAPVVLALLLSFGLRRSLPVAAHRGPEASYRDLLLDQRLKRAFALAGGFGVIWGFPFPFMTLALTESAIPAAYFFTVHTAAVFFSRFVLLAPLQSLPRLRIVLLGMLASFTAYALLAIAIQPPIVICAGMLAGIGHGLVFPSLSTWVSEQFAPADRGKPVALFNTVFNAGGYLVALAGGAIIAAFGMRTMLVLIAATGLILAIGTLSSRRTQVS
jgi:predicted MFS family arabinose efflux permease